MIYWEYIYIYIYIPKTNNLSVDSYYHINATIGSPYENPYWDVIMMLSECFPHDIPMRIHPLNLLGIIHFLGGCSIINHPAIGDPPFMETSI